MKKIDKLSRRELFEYSLKLGISSPIIFPSLSLLNSSQSFANPVISPKFLFIVYGEGQCQNMSGNKRSKFSGSGTLKQGNSSNLTLGFSGLTGIEQHSSIIQNVGVQHLQQSYTNKLNSQAGSDEKKDHYCANLAVLNGNYHCQKSIQQILKDSYNKKVIDFAASTLVDDPGKTAPAAYSLTTAVSNCSPTTVTPYTNVNTSLNGLLGNLVFNNSSPTTTTTTTTPSLRKNLVDKLLGVTENVKGRVSGTSRNVMNQYLDLLTNYKDTLSDNSSTTQGSGQNSGNCSRPDTNIIGENSPINRGLKSADIMLKAMSCDGLDVGSICFFPTNGSEKLFSDFNSGSYTGQLPGLDSFINSNVSNSADFLSKVVDSGKGNHFFSHYTASSYWDGAWSEEGKLLIDYQHSLIQKKIFEMAQGLTTTSGKRLSEELIIVTMYSMGDADPHSMLNCPITMTSEGNFFSKNKIVTGSSFENFSVGGVQNTEQAWRRSEFLEGLVRLVDTSSDTFLDTRTGKVMNLKNM